MRILTLLSLFALSVTAGAHHSVTEFDETTFVEIDGVVVTQTNGMCRYVGRMAGLYPEDDGRVGQSAWSKRIYKGYFQGR